MPKVVFCIPTVTKPYKQFLDALEASLPVIEKAGWEHSAVYEIGNPYISAARSIMLRKALDQKPDCIVFLDHDLSWDPNDLLRLINSPAPVTAGTYRFKRDDEVTYMGRTKKGETGKPIVKELVSGETPNIQMECVPAGFLKIDTKAVAVFMTAYPELLYGDRYSPSVDLFNHGAIDWTWYGEDYAFSKRWNEKCGQIWLIPDLNISHWRGDVEFKGNYHEYLLAKGREEAKLKAVK